MRNPCLEVMSYELDVLGIKYRIVKKSKHVAIEWEHKGQKRQQMTSSTPSKPSASMNARAAIRRILKNDGLIILKPKPSGG